MAAPRIIVVGGGLAGLAAVIKIAEAGGNVDLFSIVPVKRSHSVCAQGGINAAKNLKGEGDSTWQHFDDTIYGGDFLANQPPVKAMCDAAPGIIDLLDRMGVPFIALPKACSTFAASEEHSITVPRSPVPPPVSSSFMRLMSKCAVTNPKAKLQSTSTGNFSPPCSTATAFAAASAPWICAVWKCAPFLPMRSSSPRAALARSSESPPTPLSAPDR